MEHVSVIYKTIFIYLIVTDSPHYYNTQQWSYLSNIYLANDIMELVTNAGEFNNYFYSTHCIGKLKEEYWIELKGIEHNNLRILIYLLIHPLIIK